FNIVAVHFFAANVGVGDKGKLVLQLCLLALQCQLERVGVIAVDHALPVFNDGITPQDFKTHANFVNAVVLCFQLGGLVHDRFRAGYFAAVVQPGGNAKLVKLGFAHVEFGIRPAVGGNRLLQQRVGQHGHPFAVAAGIRAFGVDGVGQQLDDGI